MFVFSLCLFCRPSGSHQWGGRLCKPSSSCESWYCHTLLSRRGTWCCCDRHESHSCHREPAVLSARSQLQQAHHLWVHVPLFDVMIQYKCVLKKIQLKSWWTSDFALIYITVEIFKVIKIVFFKEISTFTHKYDGTVIFLEMPYSWITYCSAVLNWTNSQLSSIIIFLL